MSRLCVKNIPKYVTEVRLRDLFSQKGEVTDCKIMRTKDGKSRGVAFVGFRTEREAEEAMKFFNNTYLDTCRITCEVARKVGDPDIPRPWGRYSAKKGSTLDDKSNNGVGIKPQNPGSFIGKHKDPISNENRDPKLEEFLQVMRPRAKSKMWENDTLGDTSVLDDDGKVDGGGSQRTQKKQPKKRPKKQLTEAQHQVIDSIHKDGQGTVATSLELGRDGSLTASPSCQSHDIARDDGVTDMDYFRSRIKKDWSDSESEFEDFHNDNDNNGHKSNRSLQVDGKGCAADEAQPDQVRGNVGVEGLFSNGVESSGDEDLGNEEKASLSDDDSTVALESGRLFVRNLPYTTSEDELVELFSQFGDVPQVHLVVDKDTRRSKGFGYVHYTRPESAVRVLKELDNSIFQGRLLHVMQAKPQNPSNKKESDHSAFQDNMNFRQRREEQRKASEASGDTRACNTLFIRPDTVVENIARKYGISKGDLLDREADDLAVRVALGETHVIAENKKALFPAGINIDASEEYASTRSGSVKRSNHVILVKNLPYNSSERDLAVMFGKYGSVERVILLPTRTSALVIFLEAAEARVAFKNLAYKKYKDVPLYLEWALGNILTPNAAGRQNEPNNAVVEQNIKSVLLDQSVEGITETEIDPDRAESRTLYVKNLNFKTSDECLKKHFSDSMQTGNTKSVKVTKHIKNGETVSKGFGFIEFDSVETAMSVYRDLQGTVLDSHALILNICTAKTASEISKKDEKDKSSTKLMVRNVAFEATKRDLRELFSPFGQIKSIRLPMKFGKHRGYAFVEFVTKQEAQNAMRMLSSTHLYGRHLVIEWAKERESLEELREKTGAHFVDEHGGYQLQLSNKRKQMDSGNESAANLKKKAK